MCGEFFRDGQAAAVNWPVEEKEIYRQLSIISEPH
jgi:ferredoxin-NADP reductase